MSFRLVRGFDPRDAIALLTQRDDLWDPGRATDDDKGGDSGPLVLRITVGPPPVPGTRADDIAHRQTLDRLLGSPGYTADLIDLFAHHPGLGVATPTADHIGWAHGRSTWDGLAGTAKALPRRFGLSAELDPLAPVAPPDAMFMARPRAPRTLSGGAKGLVRLADRAAAGTEQSAERLRRTRATKMLELLAIYAVMSSGFRPHKMLTPVWAGWLYGALTYKHRVVTADLPAHIDEQVGSLQARFGPLAGVDAWVHTYVDVHHPDMGSALRPTYRHLAGRASGLVRAVTSTGRHLHGVGRHREEDKGSWMGC